MSDYHLHLHPHGDWPGAPPAGVHPPGYIDQYVEVALSRGVTELGFTEHLYRCVESEAVLGHWWESDMSVPAHVRDEMAAVITAERNLSLDKYVEVVLDAKSRGLPVKLGLEVDFQPGTEVAVLDLLAPYPWDFLIGSTHWLGGWEFTRAGAPAEFERRGVEQAYRDYFALETQLAAAGMVDVLAHSDVIKKWGFVARPELLDELYLPVVAAAAASGVAVEVSSSTLRQPVAQITPRQRCWPCSAARASPSPSPPTRTCRNWRPMPTTKSSSPPAPRATPRIYASTSDSPSRSQLIAPHESRAEVLSDALTAVAQVGILAFVVASMTAMGLSLTVSQVIQPLRDVRVLVLLLIANFVVVPAVTIGAARLLPIDQSTRTALIIMGCCAGAPFLPKLAQMVKGDVALAVGAMVVLMVVTVAYAPIVLPLAV